MKKPFIAGILASLAFSACSPASQNNPDARTTTKIGYIPITDHLLLGVAKERDNEAFAHLNLEPLRFPNYLTLSEALKSGDLQGAMMLAPLAFQTKISGAPIKIVSLAHRDGSALVVKVREGINTAKDLRGKTIAVAHRFSTPLFLLHYYLNEEGLEWKKDYQTVEIAPPDMFAALSAGEIDGYIVAEPFVSQAELAGVGEVLIFSSQIWEHHPDCVLVLRDEYIRDHPDAVQELITSIVRSGIFVEGNRAEGAKIASRFLGQSEEITSHALLDPQRVTYLNLTPVVSEFNRIQDYMAEKMGLFPQKVDMNELVDTTFAENAYETIKSEGSSENPTQ